jgi:hypothetical protein
MTAPANAPGTAPDIAPDIAPAGQSAPTTPQRRRRRWHRVAVPFLVLAAVWATIIVSHTLDEPDLGDPGTLSPIGTGQHGSSRLAQRLTAEGVTIERVTSARAAIRAATVDGATAGGATIFVPTPDFLHPSFSQVITDLPGSHRVVLVRPGRRTLLFSALPIDPARTRWATATVAPDCPDRIAERAGAATVHRTRYATFGDAPTVDCYGGSLVALPQGNGEIVVVGANEPFRNDRIAEVGNAELATGLLAAGDRVIWVDVHAKETTTLPEAQRPDFSLPQYRRGDRDRTNTGFPIIDAFPPILWAGMVLAAGAAVLFAVARARRLGPPVAEPLPVLVPSAEVVTGRGRLYTHARARSATLDTLRLAAIRTLIAELEPFAGPARVSELGHPGGPGPASGAFTEAIAARTGWPAQSIRELLYGDPPDDDDALARSVGQLDALVNAVRRGTPAQPQGGTP